MSRLVGLHVFRKHWELLPLVSVVSFASFMGITYAGYSLYQKPDVWCRRSDGIPPWEKVDAFQKQKLLTFEQKYASIPEQERLRKEMGSFQPR